MRRIAYTPTGLPDYTPTLSLPLDSRGRGRSRTLSVSPIRERQLSPGYMPRDSLTRS